jgi:Ca-activated chloride channel family protein
MIFLRPQYLPWLWVALAGTGLWLWWHFRRINAQEALFQPTKSPGRRRPPARALLLAAALPVLAMGLAGPSWGEDMEVRFTSGLDLYFIVDCSYSMLARDIAPSREKAATFLAMSLLKDLPGARAGLIAFAGGAFPVCPLTSDAGIINSLLAQIHPDILNRQGTNFEAPLNTLARMVSKVDSRRRMAVVFLSDGESFREPPAGVLEALGRRGLEFIAVGVGTPEGAYLDDPRSRTEAQLIRDHSGQLVRSRLEEKNLIALSQALGGRYFRLQTVGLTSRQILDGVLKHRGAGTYSSALLPKDQSSWFIAGGALLLAILLLTTGPRRRGSGAVAILTLALAMAGCGGPDPETLIRHGNDAFAKGEYQIAAECYQAAVRTAADPDIRILAETNLTAALLLDDRADDALKIAGSAGRIGSPSRYLGPLLYNLGCGQVLVDQRTAAADSFRLSLERNPADFRARWNLELLLRDQSPPPPDVPPLSAPPDDQDDQFLDSLKDQEKTLLPRSHSQPAGTGGPYW